MKTAFAMIAAFTVFTSAGASAASLCKCCSEGTESACTAVCEGVKPAQGQCIAVLDPNGNAVIGPGQNPLYDVSFRDIHLGTAKRSELEAFRRMLENARRSAETDRKEALRDFKAGKIDSAKALSLASRYDDAMVNYFLGIQAFRLARNAGKAPLPSSP